jgi:hypothetical protein
MLEEKHWELIERQPLSPTMCLVKLGNGNENIGWNSCIEYIVNSIETARPNYLFEIAVFK